MLDRVAAARSLVAAGLVECDPLCSHISQLWCGLPPQAIDWDLGLGVGGTPTHPAVNERGDLLCAHIE